VTPDIVIRNGLVVDGLGGEPARAEVAICGERVDSIGAVRERGIVDIDADGLVVAPGFIDIHSHSDYTLLVDPRAQSALHQGVTLEVLGNCGHGCFPLYNKQLAKRAIYGISDDLELTWERAGEYFDRLDAAQPAVNVLSLAPNGQLRMSALGLQARGATESELREMCRNLAESMEAGAFGLSTGLEYAAEAGASREEVAALCAIVRQRGGLYATHTRFRDGGSVGAVEEALATARSTGVRLQISHLLPRGGRQDCEQCVALVDAAAAAGQDVAFDMHTRLFGLTFLHAMLPPWLNEDRPGELRKLLRQPDVRRRILQYKSIVTASGNWQRLVLLDNTVFAEYARLSFEEIAARRSQAPGEAALDLLADSLDAQRPPMVIARIYDGDDQALAFSNDRCVPGSDATTLCTTGPLAQSQFHGAYSWAAFFYRFAVRERGFFSVAEAVRRLTAMPAGILGIKDRGTLRAGHYADVAIFDPEQFGETATTFEPNQLAMGMRHVIVNGRLTLQDGKLTGERAGSVIRRSSMA
jgi:N-acyl-D-amino-acid deacylase